MERTALELTFLRFGYGALGATLVAALTQPLDVVKTTQQSLSLSLGGSSTPPQGLWSTLVSIHRRSGFTALYAGLSPTIVRVFFGAGLYFSSLQALQQTLTPVLGGGAPLTAGILARVVAAVALSPVSVVKTRMENQMGGGVGGTVPPPHSTTSTLSLLRHIVRTEGVASLYSGLLPTLARDAPYSGLYVAIYVHAKQWCGVVEGYKGAGDWGNSGRTFAAGVIAGCIATTLTHPADVIKTRLQLRSPMGTMGGGAVGWGRFITGSMIVAEVAKVVKEMGGRGLFTGLTARVVKRGTSTALTWTLFEEGMRRSSS